MKGNLMEKKDLRDPSFWGCIIFPFAIGLYVLIGLLYKFGYWAFS